MWRCGAVLEHPWVRSSFLGEMKEKVTSFLSVFSAWMKSRPQAQRGTKVSLASQITLKSFSPRADFGFWQPGVPQNVMLHFGFHSVNNWKSCLLLKASLFDFLPFGGDDKSLLKFKFKNKFKDTN